jgi:glycerol-3-phosphate acyltransferase PlsX
MREVTIAIDAMGGDHGPHVTVRAALNIVRREPGVNIVLVGLEDADPRRTESSARPMPAPGCASITPAKWSAWTSRRPVALAHQEGLLDARQRRLGQARRGRRRGFRRQHRRPDGGFPLRTEDPARHRSARHRFSTLPSAAPASTYMLDLGANVDCSAGASAPVRHHGRGPGRRPSSTRSRPSVGLLNIGEEDIKGNDVVKQAGRTSA